MPIIFFKKYVTHTSIGNMITFLNCRVGQARRTRLPDGANSARPISFCEIARLEEYYALRTRDNGATWDVVWATDQRPDSETVADDCTMHSTFTDWLDRMHRDDGWPPSPEWPDDIAGYFRRAERRLGVSEIQKRFGPPEELLPPVVPKFYKHLGQLRE